MKKIFIALMMILFATTVTAQAAEPVRIARLPIIFHCTISDDGTRETLETKIERATHIPLNGTLQVADFLSPIESGCILEELWQKMSAADKKAKLADAMRPLAEKIDADIIVCPVMLSYGETIIGFSGWIGEEILDSRAEVELIVYDHRTDTLLDKKASRMYHDAWSNSGTASYLAAECFDIVIEQTKLRELIRAVGKN